MSEKKLFFYGLNELRALAALLVIFHHIELFKNSDHNNSLLNSYYLSYFIETIGKNGVYLFFVLSGFLITYLLLNEKENLKTISFKNFYFRRIYRIWPLYYLTIFIAFIFVPFLANTFTIFENTPYFFSLISDSYNYSLKSVLLYILFLPNLALYYFNILLVGCSQTWSIGVEEQFYILWPILVFYFTKKKLLRVFLFLLLLFFAIHIFFNPHFISKIPSILNFNTVILAVTYKIISIFPFEFMAIGAIGGYFLFYNKDYIVLFTKYSSLYVFVILAILGLTFFSVFSIYVQSIILSILFICLILITTNNENEVVLRNKSLSYIGKISYGVYMYHPFIMFLVFPFANRYFVSDDNPLLYNLFVYFFIFTLTILLSHLSYKYFESIFVRIKDKK